MKLLGQGDSWTYTFTLSSPQVPLTLQDLRKRVHNIVEEEDGVKISPEILKTENKQDSTDE